MTNLIIPTVTMLHITELTNDKCHNCLMENKMVGKKFQKIKKVVTRVKNFTNRCQTIDIITFKAVTKL
jgi:hypothetical protein